MFLESLKSSIQITAFVLVMMLVFEYLTVQTRGKWSEPISKKGWLQVIIAAFLGIIPGCLGAFISVTLYTHRVFNFAALVTVMLASFGDEAYLMISMIPQTTIKLVFFLLATSILVGLILNLLIKNKSFVKLEPDHPGIHTEDDCHCYQSKNIVRQFRFISFERAILITGLILFIIGIATGQVGHDEKEHIGLFAETTKWNWINITAIITSIISLFIVSTVPDHFLQEHLWEHLIKKHLVKIFLWTFGAIFFIHLGLEYLAIDHWIKENPFSTMLIACLIGLIPESGPHIIFIPLFANGIIPFSVLFANSLVQDGHGALPLLAESKKSFVLMKLINFGIAFLVGLAGYLIGF